MPRNPRSATPLNPPRIGCAGWSLPRIAGASFPGAGSHLERYASIFNAVEINSSFYRPHRPETYARWAAAVPDDFRFSVKLPKDITHTSRLRASARPLRQFLSGIGGLGARLGCVLIQLPPSLKFERPVVKRFLTMFRRQFEGNAVLEPRHLSWFDPRVESFLRAFDIGRAGSDPALCTSAAEPDSNSAVAYFRLHGSPRKYFSNYEESYLKDLASKLERYQSEARHPWCIFDNTAHGFATTNALRLRGLLGASAGAIT